ncbi:endoglucanase [Lachnospiraceae bacterium JC7]|nr:endoglucanase [Lachnospiraceae bacterium JC7]
MNKLIRFFSILLLSLFLLGGLYPGFSSLASESETFAHPRPSVNGKLSVIGTKLVDKDGKAVMLRGLSTHGLSWFPGFVNEGFFRQLSSDWDCDLIRLAMYSAEYVKNPSENLTLLQKGIDYAVANDMYVIVDWHILEDYNPNMHKNEAAEFFSFISTQYRDCPNIIYEICNEPNGSTSWSDICDYANEIIPVIRKNSPDSVILVGTPFYSQKLLEAADRPLAYDNIMYVLHFYVSTHRKELQDVLTEALNRDLPVFVSECGISEASGSGYADFDSAAVWFRLLEDKGISFAVWNLSNKAETSALFTTYYDPSRTITDGDLTSVGLWVRELIKKT